MRIANAVVVIAMVLSMSACRERSGDTVYRWPPPREVTATTGGVPVHIPPWLWPLGEQEALAEIDAAGVPAGWSVEVVTPYFEARDRSGAVLLVQGETLPEERRILVGFRPCDSGPALPALAHEVVHAVTGDPCAGHEGEPGCH